LYTTAYKKKRFSSQNLDKRIEQERQLDLGSLLQSESYDSSNGISTIYSSTSSSEQQPYQYMEKYNDYKPCHLLDTIRRVSGWEVPKAANLLQFKLLRDYNNMNLHEKLSRECCVVRSCMLAFEYSTEIPVSFTALLEKINNSVFLDSSDEICRKLMGAETLKETIRSLENNGEAEVTESIGGDRFVRLNAPDPDQPSDSAPPHLTSPALVLLNHLPLKFRKSKYVVPEDPI
jgi:hypothetical protein